MFNEFLQAIATVGFPVVACGAVSFAYYSTTKKFADTISKMNSDHTVEVLTMTKSIDNNTAIMERLLDNLKGGE